MSPETRRLVVRVLVVSVHVALLGAALVLGLTLRLLSVALARLDAGSARPVPPVPQPMPIPAPVAPVAAPVVPAAPMVACEVCGGPVTDPAMLARHAAAGVDWVLCSRCEAPS